MAVLDSAQAYWLASGYSGSGEWLDETVNNHDWQFGSTAGADTNDPKFFSHTGIQYLYLPNVAGNYASTPDSAALSITDNLDVRAWIAAEDWTPTQAKNIVTKYLGTGNQRSFRFVIVNGTGVLRLIASADGSADETVNSSVAPTVSDGNPLWVRFTFEAGSVKFYTGGAAATPSWTQLGTTQTMASITTIFDSTAQVEVGSHASGVNNRFIGNVYRVQMYNGVGGTLALDANFTDTSTVTEPFSTFTEGSSNAATVTINRSGTAAVALVVDRAGFYLHTDDYFETADAAGLDFAAADSCTVLVALRPANVSPASAQTLIAKRAGVANTDTGYSVQLETSGVVTGEICDGTAESNDQTAALSVRVLKVVGFVRNVSDDDVEAFNGGTGSGSPTTDATTATLANSAVLRMGRLSGAGTAYLRAFVVGAAVWRSALSDADVATAGNELLGLTSNPVVMSPAAVSTFGAAITAATPSPPGAGLGGSFRSKLWRPGMMLRTRNQ